MVPQKVKIVFQSLVILAAFNQRADVLIKGLDADFESQRAGWKSGDDFTQCFGQAIRNHFEVEEVSWLIARQKKFKDSLADIGVQIECAVDELELLHAAVQKPLQLVEQVGQGDLSHGNIQRGQAEFAGEWTSA